MKFKLIYSKYPDKVFIFRGWFYSPIRSYHSSPSAGLPTNIRCPHRADVNKFLLVFQHWHVHRRTPHAISHLLKGVNICVGNELSAINSLLTIRKSDISDERKWEFFQVVAVSVLLYGCTSWTLTICIKKKPDGNYTRMLRTVSIKSWEQHPTKQHVHNHQPPITQTIQEISRRHIELCWRSEK